MLSPPSHPRRRGAENDALVMDVLRDANEPLSAYAIADRANAKGHRIVPPQVYRTLGRLIQQQAVVRIETLNAYIAQQKVANVCLICRDCHMVEFVELPDITRTIVDAAPASHFEVLTGLIEAKGQCNDCRSAPHGAA